MHLSGIKTDPPTLPSNRFASPFLSLAPHPGCPLPLAGIPASAFANDSVGTARNAAGKSAGDAFEHDLEVARQAAEQGSAPKQAQNVTECNGV